jgi:hypothetical protein
MPYCKLKISDLKQSFAELHAPGPLLLKPKIHYEKIGLFILFVFLRKKGPPHFFITKSQKLFKV